FEDTQKVDNYYHSTLLANVYKAEDCQIHKSKKQELRKTIKRETPYRNIY
ncbi:hypothetical protein COCVIDRAFT_117037, partial [Bipolaris victoriae FI3]